MERFSEIMRFLASVILIILGLAGICLATRLLLVVLFWIRP